MAFDFRVVCEPLTHAYAALFFSAVILCIFLIWRIWFYARIRGIRNALSEVIGAAKTYASGQALAEEFEAFAGKVSQNPLLAAPWQEYRETILPPRDGSDAIRSTHDSHLFFNEHTVLAGRVNTSFWRATPNYLTGLGILGTFVGLVAGIYMAQTGLTAGTPELVNESLSRLLRGASVAFSTSFMGLFTSLVHSWRIHAGFDKISSLVAAWNAELDRLTERATLEHLTDNALGEAREQTAQLKKFNTELAVSIGEALDKHVADTLTPVLEHIAVSFDERVSDKLGPLLERIAETLNGVRTGQQNMGEDAIARLAEQFHEMLTGSTDTTIRDLAGTLSGINDGMQQTMADFGESQRSLLYSQQQLVAEIQQSMRNGAEANTEAMRTAMATVTEALSGAAHEAGAELRNAGGSLAEPLQAITSRLSEVFERLEGRRHGMADGTLGAAPMEGYGREGHSFGAAADTRTRTAETLSDLAASCSDLKMLAQESLEEFSRTAQLLSEVGEAVKQSALSTANSTRELDGVLDALDCLPTTMEAATTPLQQTTAASLRAAETITGAAQAVGDYLGPFQLQAQAFADAGRETREVWKDYREHFTELDLALQRVFAQLENGLDSYTERVASFHTELDQHLGDAVERLGAIVDELAEVAVQLGKTKGRRG